MNTLPHTYTLAVLPGRYAVCRLDAQAPVPDWAFGDGFVSITRTGDELSVACLEERVPDGVVCETGWAGLKVEGPLDFALTGVLASLATPLARAGISLFVVSTYDTDYVLVQAADLSDAIATLAEAGHTIVND